MDDIDQQKANILIVDDSITDLNVLTNFLIEHPYKLRRAISPALALDSIQAALPDLILLDINMPEMSGYDFCQRIKSDPQTRHIPVIFISASDVGLDKEKAFRSGGSDYISKPYQAEEVIVRIENQIKLQQSYHTLKRQKSKLEIALLTLRRTQHSLLESERQMTLGRIVNRITQDIAQPMGLIHTNIGHIYRQSKDMREMLALHSNESQQPLSVDDIDYIINDLDNIEKLSDDIQDLSSQLQESIHTLKTLFQDNSVADQEIDLHNTLNTMVSALSRLWQAEDGSSIQIQKKYGELGALKRPVSSLNQSIFLILNLMAELTHTAKPDASENEKDSSIILKTEQLNAASVQLSFFCNYIDISEKMNQHIKSSFLGMATDPHSRMGQSLCVIRQVILDKWKGDLSCQSQSEGMEIVLTLSNYPY